MHHNAENAFINGKWQRIFNELTQDEENLSGRELQPVEQRTRQDIEKQYKKFFAEFHSQNVSH